MVKLNGSAKYVIPVAALVTIIVSLHVLQQGELGKVRTRSTKNETAIARVDERTEAQFNEVLRSLERIEGMLK